MTDDKTPQPEVPEAAEHTVTTTSTPPRQPRAGKTVSFTVPTLPRPKLSFKNLRARTKIAAVIAVLLLSGAGGYLGATIQQKTGDTVLNGSVSNEKKIVTSESQLVSSIAKNVGPSVVSVNVSVVNETSDLGRYFGVTPQETEGAGTGIIISEGGLVLTNRHVVPAGTTEVSVTLSDGTELDDVEVLGRTNDGDSLDIALLKINDTEGKKLSAATLGDSAKVAVGDDVVAIGNALGQFQNTVTSGIISGYGRSIVAASEGSAQSAESLNNLFQTDAAINQGNSGGPLVNLNGQVIGINTAVASDSQNIGFAIPINDVKGLIDTVVKTGKFERPYLGVRYVALSADLAERYNLSVEQGAYILKSNDGSSSAIVSGGPADKAGIKEGEVITAVNGDAVDDAHSLVSRLGKYQPGDKVKLTVVNGDDKRTVTVTLEATPAN